LLLTCCLSLRYQLSVPAGQQAVVDTCRSTANFGGRAYDARLSWGFDCNSCNTTSDDACGMQSSLTIPVLSAASPTLVNVLVSGFTVGNTGPFTLTVVCGTPSRE
jgi:hypothetical protein